MALGTSDSFITDGDGEREIREALDLGTLESEQLAEKTTDAETRNPNLQEDVTNANLHHGTTTTPQGSIDHPDNPFAALRSAAAHRNDIELPGPRTDYLISNNENGTFTIRHLPSGEEVRVAGIEYLRFADLQLHNEFLTRTNPDAPPETEAAAESPAGAPQTGGDSFDFSRLQEASDEEANVSDEGDEGTVPEPPADPGPEAAPDPNPMDPGAPANEAPVAADSGFNTAEDGSITFSAGQLLAGASDAEGDPLAVVSVTGASNGTLVDNGNGTWTFTPNPDFNGMVDLTVTISDGQGGSDTATATITVDPVDDQPVAQDSTDAAIEDGGLINGNLIAGDVDGDILTYSLVTPPAEGSVTVNPDGSFTFDPGAGFQDLAVGETRDVSFTYQADDGNGGTDTGTVTVTVTGTNDGPVAADANAAATEDGGQVNGAVSATDADTNDSLTYSLDTGPAEGSATVNADGSWSFDPGAGFQDLAVGETRDVSFTYQADDGNGGTDTGTVTVTVTGTNDGPTASNRSFDTAENTAIVVTEAQLLAGAGDIDGDILSISATGSEANGSLVDNGNGTWTFTPTTDFTGQATFEFTVDDGNGGTADATATINVYEPHNQPDAPVTPTISGDDNDNILQGTTGVDVIDGAGGDDFINAKEGDDTVVAGTGNDTVHGGGGEDLIYGGEGDDIILGQQDDDTIYGGDGTDDLRGGLGNDTLYGDGGNDTLNGEQGDDTLIGGSGDDIMLGGQDDDTFVLDSATGIGDDSIDGETGSDSIDLTAANGWTVTYDNGDSFDSNDSWDTGLFTDTSGNIAFDNGDQVSFENVESFSW